MLNPIVLSFGNEGVVLKLKKKFRRLLSKLWHLKAVQLFVPSKIYCALEYKRHFGKKLNIKNPKTFNEKIQWLKLNDHNALYPKLVDKYEVRKYVREKLGEQYLIKLIGIYNCVEDIPFNSLPKEYVLKCTHDSGTVVINNSLCTITEDEIRKLLNKALRKNYYYEHREWPYKRVKPRVICETYMVDESNSELKDYKIHCFGGVPKLIQVDFGRFTNHRRNLYDTQWNFIDASILYPNDKTTLIKKPDNLAEILEVSSVLSQPFAYVRVDLYIVENRIFFGELTFHHGAGYEKFTPHELEVQMGEWLMLPKK